MYDLGIIGGGICGAGVARDAALRGLRVVLFEKSAFADGASGKSSKLIHGGIRYLELAWNALARADLREAWKNLRFVFVSLRESRVLRRIAPDIVEPLPLVIPVYRSDKRGLWTVYAGALLYSLLALSAAGRAKFPSLYGKKTVLRILPGLNPNGLSGAVRIWDHRADDKALVVATLRSAEKHGAKCFENAPVVHYRYEKASNAFRMDVDGLGVARARKLIDATGAWVDRTRTLGGEKEKNWILPVAGAHITLKAFLPSSALLQAKDGRFFFVIRHGDKARVGTTERVVSDLDSVRATEEEIDYLLGSLRRYFPQKNFTRADVLASDAGVRPLPAPETSRDPNGIPREHEIRVSASGCIHLLGVKLTDHRRAAEEAVDRLIPSLLPANPKLLRKTLTHRLPLGT